MRVAGNRVSHISDFFHEELDSIYGKEEVDALFKEASAFYLGIERNELRIKFNEHVNQSDLIRIYDCVKALKTGKPFQYITGETLFYGNKFLVDPSVLIPRPETEELVDLILKENPNCSSVVDIGTGSGCIIISILKKLSKAKGFACDVSKEALNAAKGNAKINQVNLSFFQADVLDSEKFKKDFGEKLDLIVSNPPYIKLSEKESMHKNVLDHEPHLALFVEGDDEVIFYRSIIDLSKELLSEGGKLYFELNPLTGNDVATYAKRTGLFKEISLLKDISGKTRFFRAVRD